MSAAGGGQERATASVLLPASKICAVGLLGPAAAPVEPVRSKSGRPLPSAAFTGLAGGPRDPVAKVTALLLPGGAAWPGLIRRSRSKASGAAMKVNGDCRAPECELLMAPSASSSELTSSAAARKLSSSVPLSLPAMLVPPACTPP